MFRATAAKSMKYTGIGIKALREAAGPGFGDTTESASKSLESRVSQRENFPQINQ